MQAQKQPKVTQKPIGLPQNAERDLLSWQYPTFAQEGAYALAGSVAKHALLPNAASLRHLDFEGMVQPICCLLCYKLPLATGLTKRFQRDVIDRNEEAADATNDRLH